MRLASAGFADGEICIGVRCRDHYSSLRIAFPGATEQTRWGRAISAEIERSNGLDPVKNLLD